MKVVLQIVKEANVKVNNALINEINNGYLLLVGIDEFDNEEIVKKMASKIINLRINKDSNDKTNLTISQVQGEILAISQFTLCAILDSRRPSFSHAAKADMALRLYELFVDELNNLGITTKKGVFGEHMEVSLINDGPFTLAIADKDL